MTKEEIIEGNKLIAEFMNWKEENISKDLTFYYCPKNIRYNPLIWHSSWDWLMPVVEKIAETFDVSISSCGLWVTTISRKDVYDGEISSMGGLEPIENTYTAIVRFLEWYNKQPKYKKK